MTVMVLLKARTRAGLEQKFKDFIEKCLVETRQFSGFVSIDIYEHQKRVGEFVFYEKWETVQAYEAYLSWRGEQGVMDKIQDMLVEPPEISYFDHINI